MIGSISGVVPGSGAGVGFGSGYKEIFELEFIAIYFLYK
jgi:hypothetical protein